MKTIIIILLLSFSFVLTKTKAQVVSSLYFMDNLPQASILNPAFSPNYNFYFGLPIINNVNLHLSSDIGLNDIYSNGHYVWNKYEELYKPFVNDLHKTSYISTELNTSLFNMGFRSGKNFIHLAINTRMDFKWGIPRGLFKMNDLSIVHDLSGLGFNGRIYNEYTVGLSREINDKLNVGITAKYLKGIGNASIEFNKFDITTTEEAWTYDVRGTFDVSGPVEIEKDEDDFPTGFHETEDFNNPGRIIDLLLANGGNSGFGLDLGVEYEVIPQLKLSASLIDLGKINWKKQVENINFDANYSFKGISDLATTGDDGIFTINDDAFSSIIDSLKDSYTSNSTHNAFSNNLSPKLYLAAEYELTSALSLGLISKTRFIEKERRQNFIFAANANFNRILTLGLNYNIGLKTQNSYGGVLGLRMFPFYIFVATDVIPGYSSGGSTITSENEDPIEIPVSLPANLSAVNFQFGINIVIGERQRQAAKKKNSKSFFEKPLESSSFSYPF